MGPLSGLKIIEIAGMGPAPFCGMVLADLGAEVLRIDRIETVGRDPAWDLRGRNKRSIALDLKCEAGLRALMALVVGADALIEGFRPGVAERLGIGPETCVAANPRLVYGRATGWGQTGPRAPTAGHDINYIGLTGVLDMIGPKDGPPVPPLNLIGDYAGGAMFLALGVLAAIHEAKTTGKGQVIDGAMIDGVNSLLAVYHGFLADGRLHPRRGENLLDGGTPWYATYPCADGKHVAVGALEDKFYAAFVRGLGFELGELPDRGERANRDGLRALFAAKFLQRGRDDWAAHFADTDACVTPVLSLAEAPADAQHRHRGSIVEIKGIGHPRPAPRFSDHPAPPVSPPVAAGQDTCAVLAELGWSDADIASALASGAAAAIGK